MNENDKVILKQQIKEFLNDSLYEQMDKVLKRFRKKFGKYESGWIKFYNSRNNVEIDIEGVNGQIIYKRKIE